MTTIAWTRVARKVPTCRLRHFSTSITSSDSPKPLAYVSLSTHPHFNLSLEHYLLRSRPANTPVCFLYRNDPCIVIGRNQNPWRELDVTRMRQLGIKLVRRRSGGGAVYHDHGNTNYSFHIARELFTRQQHAELVARALNADPVALKSSIETDLGDHKRGAYVNKRNDICIALKNRKAEDSERKISGSAYKIISSRAYHHGTMLLSSNLSHLGSALKPSRTTMQSKGVESVPSPVSNLVDAFVSRRQALSHEHFCEAVIAEFQRTYGMSNINELHEGNYKNILGDHKDELQGGWREMDSWDWTWGQTPEFSHRIRCDGLPSLSTGFEIDLHVRHGVIQSTTLRCDTAQEDVELSDITESLQGKHYDDFGDAPDTFGKGRSTTIETDERLSTPLAAELISWFKTVL